MTRHSIAIHFAAELFLWCVDSLAQNELDAKAAEHLADALKNNKALLELK